VIGKKSLFAGGAGGPGDGTYVWNRSLRIRDGGGDQVSRVGRAVDRAGRRGRPEFGLMGRRSPANWPARPLFLPNPTGVAQE